MRASRFSAATLAAVTASALVVATPAAPTASAWETKYNRSEDKCTIAFDSRDQQRVNVAFKTLFTEMARQTENPTLKKSFTDAAARPFFDGKNGTVVMSPDEALENGGLGYGLDIKQIVLPYGVGAVVEGIDISSLLTEDTLSELLKDVDFENVIGAVDLEEVLKDVNVSAAVQSLPLRDIVNNIDMKAILPSAQELGEILKPDRQELTTAEKAQLGAAILRSDFDTSNRLIAKALGLSAGGYSERFLEAKGEDLMKEFERAFKAADLDTKKVVNDALKAAEIDFKNLIGKIMDQPEFKKALNDELKKINIDGLIDKVLNSEDGNIDVEKLLGYRISDISLAAQDAIDAVGPQVLGPILTMNDAFTACTMHSDRVKKKPSGSAVGSSGTRSSSDKDTVKGSVAGGSSLDMDGLKAVSILGVVAALLFTGVVGFALRPILEQGLPF